jgi:hypothetical protein
MYCSVRRGIFERYMNGRGKRGCCALMASGWEFGGWDNGRAQVAGFARSEFQKLSGAFTSDWRGPVSRERLYSQSVHVNSLDASLEEASQGRVTEGEGRGRTRKVNSLRPICAQAPTQPRS